jgi:putative membrane protein
MTSRNLVLVTAGLMLASAGMPTTGVGWATSASAQTQVTLPLPKMRSEVAQIDREFLHRALQQGQREVALARLAEQKSSDERVQKYAITVEQDQLKMNEELESLAKRKHVEIDEKSDRMQRILMERLEQLDGIEFNQAFLTQMIGDHRVTIAEFERHASDSLDIEIQAFAEQSLPALRRHLQEAEALTATE